MECPYCREEIADGAKKCRYCNEFLDKDADTHPSLLGQIDQISNILTDYVKKLIIWLFVALIAYLIYDYSQKPSSKITEEEKVELKNKIQKEITVAFEFAKSSPYPEHSTARNHVYA